ncbi:SURF1 family protein [Dyella telluris]|uniref:SURF1-like protein n=1 Tax=Dyella telluris TaxID=2763498 RepID=A0A7G8Q980_9GAMM|nr:SURF1 family protein [Dyella telluris]QNK03338.1 SURF1 family protein [Dyella telluris]
MSVAEEPGRQPRGPVALALLALLGVILFSGFVALGTWQVYRLGWKRDLIARVETRVHAPAVTAPGPDQWSSITAESAEYRHVQLQGHFLYDRRTLVWAATDFGSGYWLMTPLQQADGTIVLVNRGFVPADWCGVNGSCAAAPTGDTTVTGLLRVSETARPLRHNDPARNSWYTRDVAAIATARGLTHVAPYFVDEEAAPGTLEVGKHAWPQGGLTVISFPNNHLSYLITWYLLALMVLGAGIYVARDEKRLRRGR